MENPRKRSNRTEGQSRRGQVVDLKAYRARHNKKGKTEHHVRPNKPPFRRNRWEYLRWLCFALVAVTVVFAVLGLCPISWSTQAAIIAVFTGTVGLGCGLWLNAVGDVMARRVLLFLSGAFVIAYLCALFQI
ncbi:hypothetical protein [Alicyclobacillus acidoterrestris]|uniref:Uncharacterized protein n=1 Tax=Alicyclobacillus acidoterrestris (strain ATCC 49025 / DSM 3922 / CIP 106132 / NCIMB 13137 / GD3B) TaxID=1356854 RepID=T0D3Z0_ALIAG|nr:hypothetical protein [Alicyclobacillus acidoterrestris]EPZ46287.1 hypothetical protein N007_07265 [Alicyclobacillus acidoterrestris ATCC 49025]UNO50700.1 hypothetical protein K1I37_09960 [Alicyclobacillus acidoterrestris]